MVTCSLKALAGSPMLLCIIGWSAGLAAMHEQKCFQLIVLRLSSMGGKCGTNRHQGWQGLQNVSCGLSEAAMHNVRLHFGQRSAPGLVYCPPSLDNFTLKFSIWCCANCHWTRLGSPESFKWFRCMFASQDAVKGHLFSDCGV